MVSIKVAKMVKRYIKHHKTEEEITKLILSKFDKIDSNLLLSIIERQIHFAKIIELQLLHSQFTEEI